MPTLDWTWLDQVDDVGDPIDFEVLDEIQANVEAVNAALGDSPVETTTNGAAGRVVTIPDQETTNYFPLIVFAGSAPGDIGEWSIVRNSSTQFTLYNSGLAGIAFIWKILK